MNGPSRSLDQVISHASHESETAFQFEEIQPRESIATLGHRPATETLEIEVGTVSVQSEEVEKLQDGVVVALKESVDDEVLVRHGDRVIAKGAMTVVNGKIAIRISETYSPSITPHQ